MKGLLVTILLLVFPWAPQDKFQHLLEIVDMATLEQFEGFPFEPHIRQIEYYADCDKYVIPTQPGDTLKLKVFVDKESSMFRHTFGCLRRLVGFI